MEMTPEEERIDLSSVKTLVCKRGCFKNTFVPGDIVSLEELIRGNGLVKHYRITKKDDLSVSKDTSYDTVMNFFSIVVEEEQKVEDNAEEDDS